MKLIDLLLHDTNGRWPIQERILTESVPEGLVNTTITSGEPARWAKMPRFVVDNVAAYYYGDNKEYWLIERDFPALAPPFREFWMEFLLPRVSHSTEFGDVAMADNDAIRLGFVFYTEPRKAGGWRYSITGYASTNDQIVCSRYKVKTTSNMIIGADIPGPVCLMSFEVDEQGLFIKDTYSVAKFPGNNKEYATDMHYMLYPCLLSLSLLQTKNVQQVIVQHPQKFVDCRRKRGKPVPHDFRCIRIMPLTEKAPREVKVPLGQFSASSISISRRGSFAHYGAAYGRGKLFGKYEGRFWRDAHAGAGGKEYEVKK